MSRASRVLIFLLALLLLFSFGYAAAESAHDCHGEDCPICKIIALVSLMWSEIALFVLLLAPLCVVSERTVPDERGTHDATLVALKVKLSN